MIKSTKLLQNHKNLQEFYKLFTNKLKIKNTTNFEWRDLYSSEWVVMKLDSNVCIE